jgi:enoyl-CoA hydratase
MNFENLLIKQNEQITTVYINRPKKLNALNSSTIKELHTAFKALEDDKSCKIILLTGSGEKAFVAGADISEFAHFSKNEGAELAKNGQETVFDFIENFSKPIIACVNGFALGGGLELAMACHFRIASDNAKLGLPEVSLGVIPGYGGTQRLPQLIGKGKAMELILTANMIDAHKAKTLGLVNHVVTQKELLPLGEKLAKRILQNSPNAVANAIYAVNSGYKKEGFATEISAFGNCFQTDDFIEGTTAFLEKRKPKF